MFYSESLSSPINSYNVKRLYGVNPDNDPAHAALIGIYPLTEVPDGYTPTHYVKEGDRYRAVPNSVSNEELAMVHIIRREHVSLHELELNVVPEWQPDVTYAAGDHAKHEGKVYVKADDADNSEPDDVPGGWEFIR
jgi:hypothetical protein